MFYKIKKNNLKLAILLIISLAPSLGWTKDDFTTDYAKKMVKLSKAADIKSLLNTEIDPCNDFYTFSCKIWEKINPANSFTRKLSTDKFDGISKGIEQRLKKLLTVAKSGNENVENKIKDFYQSCRNTKIADKQYRLAVESVYKEFGQFSFKKTEKQLTKNDFQWWSAIAKIQNIYGKSIILAVDILDDIKNKNDSRTMLYLGTPNFDMTQSAVNNMFTARLDKVKIYLKLVFGINDEVATKVANELVDFEYSLSAGATDVREGKSVADMLRLYNTTDLKNDYAYTFDVEKFLQIVLGTNELPEQVYVYDEEYLENLIDVFNSTDTNIVENYILWLLLQEFIVEFDDSDIDNVCTEKSKKYFGKFLEHVIYNQYRTKKGEDDIYELWDDIKSQFRDNLNGTKYNWMSISTREHAIKKLTNMNLSINSYDNDDFIEFFENIHIDSTNYVENLQNILKHAEAIRENKMAKKSESIEDTQTTSYTPVYNIFTNEIKIPIALLQPFHIWDANYPKAIQYATLGFLIAHEMTHGFDDEGRNYDANGEARSWWDEESENAFELQRQCFQDQYHSYTYADDLLPDSVLQSENIADNSGLQLSYAAYERWLAKHKDVIASETLPRLDYNSRELFFISFAQLWCEDIDARYKISFVNNDVHAPAIYRTIGSLSNFREFSGIWNCPKDSPMNPSNKCELY